MKRWLMNWAKTWLAGGVASVLVVAALSGCGQNNTFLTKEVYENCHTSGLPPKLEHDHCPITGPLTVGSPAPPTVGDPDRPPRYLTLQEAIAIALENGTASSRAGAGRGLVDDTLATFNGQGSLSTNGQQSDRIRVLALNPAIYGAAIEANISRFDPVVYSGMNWIGTDELQQGFSSFNNGNSANFETGIIKALPSGGVAGIRFVTSYTNLNNPPTGTFGVINPNYTARLSLSFEQPLWRDFGVDTNQLLSRLNPITGLGLNSNLASIAYNAHQATVSSGFVGQQVEGILISRLRFDQSRAEFERNMQVLLLNTEVAYWNLYNKYGQLYSFEENLRVLQRAVDITEKKKLAGAGDRESVTAYYQTRGQFAEFRGERVRALQEVLEAERNLRGILGMPNEDGCRLVPITPPTLSELKPNWDCCLHDALNSRPEIALARDNLRYHQYLLTVQKNSLRPDLRAYARYEPVGIGSTLSGSDTFDNNGTPRTTNAFASLAGGNFTDYQFGVNLIVPIGFRFENASVRAARLQLSQSYYFLKDQEDRATRFLHQQYQELDRWYKLIEATRTERLGYQEALKVLVKQSQAGIGLIGGPQSLEIQRRFASAYVKEFNAIAEYNNSLARLEWAKGGTLRHNSVHISEGPLPQCAQVRATIEEKLRTDAHVLRERPDSLTQPGRMCASKLTELLANDGPTAIDGPPAVVDPWSAPAPAPAKESSSKVVPKAPAETQGKAKKALLGEIAPKKFDAKTDPVVVLPKVFDAKPAPATPINILPAVTLPDAANPFPLPSESKMQPARPGTPGANADIVTPMFRSVPDMSVTPVSGPGEAAAPMLPAAPEWEATPTSPPARPQ